MKIEREEGPTHAFFSQRGDLIVLKDSIEKAVPVINIRTLEGVKSAADLLAHEKTVLIYGGIWGIVGAIEQKWVRTEDRPEQVRKMKEGRRKSQKFPIFGRPEDIIGFIDRESVHPAFRTLTELKHYQKLHNAIRAPIHFVFPVQKYLEDLDESLVTTPDDLKEEINKGVIGQDRLVFVNTFDHFWMEDSFWRELAFRATWELQKPVNFVVSSFNSAGEHPPYTKDELPYHIENTGVYDFDGILYDPWFEQEEVFSSHTIARFPLVGEEPNLFVIRIGSLSTRGLENITGIKCVELPSTSYADRKWSHLTVLDNKLRNLALRVEREYYSI